MRRVQSAAQRLGEPGFAPSPNAPRFTAALLHAPRPDALVPSHPHGMAHGTFILKALQATLAAPDE